MLVAVASEPAIGVVCVGAGWVTGERHVPALRADPRVRVVGVVDRDRARAEAMARKAGAPYAGTSLAEDWVAEAAAVTVGAPPLVHADLAGSALERGLHCLCEKPLALPAGAARDLAARAREAGRVLAVVHNFQFARSAVRLFDLVDRGDLGELRSVRGIQLSNPRRRLPSWYAALPGGLFTDEAPHLLYLLRRFLGRLEPRVVDGRVEDGEVAAIEATFAHERIWATLSMDFRASVSEWQLVVTGDRATAALDVFRDVLVVAPNDGAHRGREILRTSARLVGGHLAGTVSSGARLLVRRLHYGNDAVVRRFCDAIEGDASALSGIGAEDGIEVVAALEELRGRLGATTR